MLSAKSVCVYVVTAWLSTKVVQLDWSVEYSKVYAVESPDQLIVILPNSELSGWSVDGVTDVIVGVTGSVYA